MFEENPLADFVELPDDGKAQDELWYSNILCGILRGALEMVSTSLILLAAYDQYSTARGCQVLQKERTLAGCCGVQTNQHAKPTLTKMY